MENYIQVLLVEDNAGDVRLIREMLKDSGAPVFKLTHAETLAEAMEHMNTLKADVILLDLNLPDSTGISTFESVSSAAPSVPIVVLTGLSDEDLAMKTVQNGAQDYLVKGQVESGLMVRSLKYAIERKKIGNEIKAALEERGALLKEIHHRVKNNMQIITSLLGLQAKGTSDPKIIEMLNDSQNRIKSMALIHEKLYNSQNFSGINFNQYISEIIALLFRVYKTDPDAIQIEMDTQPMFFSLDKAIPCGLIINELISNSLKYAFKGRDKGRIYTGISREENGVITLRVRDNGVGLPKKFNVKASPTLGLNIVSILVEQMDASMKINSSDGTEFEIKFRDDPTGTRSL